MAPIPTSLELFQSYPNPFNAQTTIEYDLPEDGNVRILIFNIHDDEVRILYNGPKRAGMHRMIWDGQDSSGCEVGSGVYFSVIRLSEESKMVKLIKLQ